MIASGAIGLCVSSPSSRATSRAGRERMSFPSSSTLPRRGAITRASARSAVDLPQALGPMMAVTEPSGIVRSRSRATTRAS